VVNRQELAFTLGAGVTVYPTDRQSFRCASKRGTGGNIQVADCAATPKKMTGEETAASGDTSDSICSFN